MLIVSSCGLKKPEASMQSSILPVLRATKRVALVILGERGYASSSAALRLRWFQFGQRFRGLRRKSEYTQGNTFPDSRIRKQWLSKEPLPDLAPDSPLHKFL
jgi:hypothetical protein